MVTGRPAGSPAATLTFATLSARGGAVGADDAGADRSDALREDRAPHVRSAAGGAGGT
ncbi:hypothetical protein [Kineococcus gypseus]|uniref:hypothetical protein n=1 Tax=Kineococcus gypseus TaxID=1637102 RepID=UPI003D7EDEEB